MPELVEVGMMAQLINKFGRKPFTSLAVSSVARGPLPQLPVQYASSFYVSAAHRGKELLVTFGPRLKKHSHFPVVVTRWGMGMSGNWQWIPAGNELPKHAHLTAITKKGDVLAFVDVRRFGRWHIDDQWTPNRSPCPLRQFDDWKLALFQALDEKPALAKKPIGTMLLDQSLFNGIGNYLRAEIAHRAKIHPETSLGDAIGWIPRGDNDQVPPLPSPPPHDPHSGTRISLDDVAARVGGSANELSPPSPSSPFCDVVREILVEVVKNKLGDLNDNRAAFSAWLQVYGRSHSYVDMSKRRMWFDPSVVGARKLPSPLIAPPKSADDPEEPPQMGVPRKRKKRPSKKRKAASEVPTGDDDDDDVDDVTQEQNDPEPPIKTYDPPRPKKRARAK